MTNWKQAIKDFTNPYFDYKFADNEYRVEFFYIGEGNCDDYHSDDPDDVPRLRFYGLKKIDGVLKDMDDASYCTLLTPATPVELLERYADLVADTIDRPSYRRALEGITWISEEELENARP